MEQSMRAQTITELRQYFKDTPVHQLAKKYGTPLLLLDTARVAQQYNLLQQSMPGVRFYYALKALPHLDVVRTLAKNNGYIDVATPREIELALQGGITPDRLAHTHPIKKPADIKAAYKHGVRMFVIDNQSELQKFTGYPEDTKLLIRLNYHDAGAKSDLSYKFGVTPAEAEDLLKAALGHKLTVAGFTLHVGSQSSSAQSFGTALTGTVQLMEKLEAAYDVRFTVLNMGGGFPIRYREAVPSIQEIADVVNPIIKPLLNRYTICAEPGRFVVGPAVHALTGVVGVTQRYSRPWYYLDDGLYGSFGGVIWEDARPAIIAEKELDHDIPAEDLIPSTLAGPTCDSVDIIETDYPLPPLAPGDILVTPGMGAYTAATTTEFNGIPPAPIVLVDEVRAG